MTSRLRDRHRVHTQCRAKPANYDIKSNSRESVAKAKKMEKKHWANVKVTHPLFNAVESAEDERDVDDDEKVAGREHGDIAENTRADLIAKAITIEDRQVNG